MNFKMIHLGTRKGSYFYAVPKPQLTKKDDKSMTSVSLYMSDKEKESLSRTHFVFKGTKPQLVIKYIHVYTYDIESNIDYWRKKYFDQTLEIRSTEIHIGHTLRTRQTIQLTSNKYLDVENNRVVQINWTQ